MNKYELVYIVDAHLTQDIKNDIAKQVQEFVTKSDGKVASSSVWMEKQRFTFPIKKVWEGTYYMLNVEAHGPAMAKINLALRMNEQLLRHMTIKVEDKKA